MGTDPLRKDTDGDNLCDGLCEIRGDKQICDTLSPLHCTSLPLVREEGEDKNLNGIVDPGETDPRKYSTLNDGLSDEQRYYKCLLRNKPEKC